MSNLITTPFLNALERDFSSETDTLIDRLRSTCAVIAGGSVLAPYAGFESNDYDFYVPMSGGVGLMEFFESIGYKLSFSSHDLPYQSYMEKAGILKRFRLYKHAPKGDGHLYCKMIDVMILPDSSSPVRFVTNFDISVCQTWFDGDTVTTTDFHGIENGTATLSNRYLAEFKADNPYLLKRIDKYTKRGFTISLALASAPKPLDNKQQFAKMYAKWLEGGKQVV